MTTPHNFETLGSIVAGKLYGHLERLCVEHGVDMQAVAKDMGAGVFDISVTIPGANGGPFEGSKFKMTISLMPIGEEAA